MKKILSLLLAVLLVFSILPAGASAEDGEAYHSEEVVYGVLSAEGDVNKILPVVIIDASQDTEIKYYGRFTGTKNLTDTEKLTVKNGSVELKVPRGRFYFESDLKAAELPWIFNISYSLDGEEITPEELGGKSGHLEISIDIEANPRGDRSFFDAYLLQISMTLDSLKCKNIKAEGATEANAGSNKMMSFMAMPGIESHLSLSADVSEFSMPAMNIAAVPLSMADMLNGMGGITEGIDSFGSALTQLSEGVGMLAGGAGQLRDGFGMFGAGLKELSNNSAAIVGASSMILDGLVQLSDTVAALKEMGSNIDIAKLSFLPPLLYRLADVMDYAAQLLGDSQTEIDATISAVSGMMDEIIDISEEELEALWQKNPNSQALQLLIYNYRILVSIRDSWYQAVENFLSASDSMGGIIQQLADSAGSTRDLAMGLENFIGSGGEGGEMGSYIDQLIGLGDNYAQFHEGLVAYTGGVDMLAAAGAELYGGTDALADGTQQLSDGTSQIPEKLGEMMGSGEEFTPHSFLSDKNENVKSVQFVFSTEAISLPEPEEPEAEPEEEKTGIELLFQRFIDLFRKQDEEE